MVLEVDPAKAVIWTKPDDLPFNAKSPSEAIGKPYPEGFTTAYGDGSARLLPNTLTADQLRAAFTAAGNEKVDF